MKNITIICSVLIITCLSGCTPILLKREHDCLDKALSYVIQNDYHSILYPKDELLIIVNFSDETNNVRISLLSKEIYPFFLVDKEDSPIGFTHYQGITLLGYRDSKKYLKLRPIRSSMIYLKRAEIPEPESGLPPLPPPSIEPLIFSFDMRSGCFQLVSKTVADTLIN